MGRTHGWALQEEGDRNQSSGEAAQAGVGRTGLGGRAPPPQPPITTQLAHQIPEPVLRPKPPEQTHAPDTPACPCLSSGSRAISCTVPQSGLVEGAAGCLLTMWVSLPGCGMGSPTWPLGLKHRF